MEQLLNGYKVLDFTHAIAGPTSRSSPENELPALIARFDG